MTTERKCSFLENIQRLTDYREAIQQIRIDGKGDEGFSPKEVETLRQQSLNITNCIQSKQLIHNNQIRLSELSDISGIDFKVSCDKENQSIFHQTEVHIFDEQSIVDFKTYLGSIELSRQSGTINIGFIKYGLSGLEIIKKDKTQEKITINSPKALKEVIKSLESDLNCFKEGKTEEIKSKRFDLRI